jgi:predicted RNase H-like HicB family nuclease
MIDLLFRKGYQGTFFFDEDNRYHGEVLDRHIKYSGKNLEELRENFEKAVDLYIELQEEL